MNLNEKHVKPLSGKCLLLKIYFDSHFILCFSSIPPILFFHTISFIFTLLSFIFRDKVSEGLFNSLPGQLLSFETLLFIVTFFLINVFFVISFTRLFLYFPFPDKMKLIGKNEYKIQKQICVHRIICISIWTKGKCVCNNLHLFILHVRRPMKSIKTVIHRKSQRRWTGTPFEDEGKIVNQSHIWEVNN